LVAGGRGRRQVVVGGSRQSWEAAGSRRRYESEAFFRPDYFSVAANSGSCPNIDFATDPKVACTAVVIWLRREHELIMKKKEDAILRRIVIDILQFGSERSS
jgi:hypothetical protein